MSVGSARRGAIGLRFLVAVVGLLLAAPPALSQGMGLSDEQVLTYLNLALDNYPRFLCEDGNACAPATAEEKANPPLTIEETRAILGQGIISAVAEHCGLDWEQRSFLPMMAYFRQRQGKTERQMALVGGVHGIIQGQLVTVLTREGACSDEMRQGAEQRLGPQP